MFNFKDFFNISKGIKTIFNPTNTVKVLNYAVSLIIKFVDNNDLVGVEKKTEVDEAVQTYITKNIIGDLMNNKYLKPLFNAILYSVIPMVTQTLYDCLKAFIQNLTTRLEEGEA